MMLEAALAASLAWSPQPGPQTALLACPVKDVFYGGARGGGKTDGLLGDWLAHAGKWGKHASGIFFRKTYPQLDDAIKRSRELFTPLGAVYNESQHMWKMPGGAQLRFRFMEAPQDATEYQGQSITWAGFDELTNWPTPEGVDKIFACLRSTHGVPCVRRSGGNPGGPGHAWVQERYVDAAPAWRVFKYKPQPDVPSLEIEAVFIPAKLEDNALLTKAQPDYESNIAASVAGDPDLYKAWRYGLWNILRGSYFKNFGGRHVYRDQNDVPPWATRWISCDWGYAHHSAILWWAFDGNTVWTYRELLVREHTPVALARLILDYTKEPIAAAYIGHDAFANDRGEGDIASEMSAILTPAGLPAMARVETKRRIPGWQLMNEKLVNGTWRISHLCPNLIKRIPTAIRDEKNPEDVLKFDGDDVLDSARMGLTSMPSAPDLPHEVRLMERITATDPTARHIQHLIAERDLEHDEYEPVRLYGRR